MDKITLTERDLERITSEATSMFAESRELLSVLIIRALNMHLKRKGIELSFEVPLIKK